MSLGAAALFVAALAGLSAFAASLVLASRDLMIADFMTYRGIAIMVAARRRGQLAAAACRPPSNRSRRTIPGRVYAAHRALTAPTSRALYTFALLALYATPALLALTVLARDLARARGTAPLALTPTLALQRRGGAKVARIPFSARGRRPEGPMGMKEGCSDEVSGDVGAMRPASRRRPTPIRRSAPPSQAKLGEGDLALGVAAVFVAYPAAMAVAARGMPDVGGLVLAVCALRLAERLGRLLALPKGQDARIAPMTRRVALALALTMFAMFAFRRWYAFAAAGIAIVLAIEIASIALRKAARFRWKDAVAAAALGLLTLLALDGPVIVDWLPNLSAHDYASAYAAYRKPLAVLLRELSDWVGLIPALAGLAGAAFFAALARPPPVAADPRRHGRRRRALPAHPDALYPSSRSDRAGDRRADRRLVDAHLPRAPHVALLGLAGLTALTLSPLAAALNPIGLAPIAGLPHAPRADLDELERLKNWVDQRARPDAKVCGLGSSYTFSGQLIDELWQLHPERGTDWLRRETSVAMPDVDEVDGPPAAGLRDCAIIIVGDPVQAHLDPDHQQTIILPSRQMLTGQGIGAKYRRTGEVFHLEKGVSAIVFERIAPLDDADIAALQARWRAARAALGFEEAGRRQ